MLTGKHKKGKQKPKHRLGSQRWAAQELGVTHVHLNFVLNGRRKSRSLMQRYNELMCLIGVEPQSVRKEKGEQ